MSGSLEEMVSRVQAAMADDAKAAGDTGAAPEATEFRGEAADGRVRAIVSADGHVRALTIDPTLLRQPLAEVSAAAVAAVNAALGQRPGTADLSPLVDVLRTVREQAAGELSAILGGFGAVESAVRSVRADQHEGRRP